MVDFYEKDLPLEIKDGIENQALSSEAYITGSQKNSVFSIPPITNLDMLPTTDKSKYRYWVGDEVTLLFKEENTPFKIVNFYKDNVRLQNQNNP